MVIPESISLPERPPSSLRSSSCSSSTLSTSSVSLSPTASPSRRPPLYPTTTTTTTKKKVHFASCIDSYCGGNGDEQRTCSTYETVESSSLSCSSYDSTVSLSTSVSSSTSTSSSCCSSTAFTSFSSLDISFPLSSSTRTRIRQGGPTTFETLSWEEQLEKAAQELSNGIHQIARAARKQQRKQQKQKRKNARKTTTTTTTTTTNSNKEKWKVQLLNLLGGIGVLDPNNDKSNTNNHHEEYHNNDDDDNDNNNNETTKESNNNTKIALKNDNEEDYSPRATSINDNKKDHQEKESSFSSPVDLLIEGSFHKTFFSTCMDHSIPSSLIQALRLLRALEIQQTYDQNSIMSDGVQDNNFHHQKEEEVPVLPITLIATDNVYKLWNALVRYYRKRHHSHTDHHHQQQHQQQQQSYQNHHAQEEVLLFLQPPDLLSLLALSGMSYPHLGIHVGQAVSLSIVSFAKYCLLSSHVEFLHGRRAIRHMMQDIKELLHSNPSTTGMSATTTATDGVLSSTPVSASISSSASSSSPSSCASLSSIPPAFGTKNSKHNKNKNGSGADFNRSQDLDVVYMNEKDSHSMRMIFRAVRTLVYLIRYSYEKPKRKYDKHRSSSLLSKKYNSTNHNHNHNHNNNNDRYPKTTTILLNDFNDAGGYGLMRYIVENYSCHYENVDSTVVRHTWMKLENILLSCRKKAAVEQQSNVDSHHYNKQRNLLESIGEE